MRLLIATGAVAIMASTGVTAMQLASHHSQAPSPLAAVTGALAETSAESYSFRLDSTSQIAGSEVSSSVATGAFDPRRELGMELLTTRSGLRSARMQIRFVGNYVYTWIAPGSGFKAIAKPWDKAPRFGPGGTTGDDPYSFATDRPVSPAGLSRVLAAAGTVRYARHASGPGRAGTIYVFTARLSGGRNWESLSGTVYLDQQGRVRRLVTITAEPGFTTDRNLRFGEFGSPVTVAAPPARQVEYTSTPPWGLYF
jgi:hypothetical protein